MTEDSELLRRYSDSRDEACFAQLVVRHTDFVYSVALRQVGGDAHAAKDVAQVVFVAMARQARSLAARAALSGWLYQATRNTAAMHVRTEVRRRAREQAAQVMNEINAEPVAEINWDAVRPVVDNAMADLSDKDRDALMLRFAEN